MGQPVVHAGSRFHHKSIASRDSLPKSKSVLHRIRQRYVANTKDLQSAVGVLPVFLFSMERTLTIGFEILPSLSIQPVERGDVQD